MQPTHAANTCSQHMQPTHAANTCSQHMQPTHAANTCSQHTQPITCADKRQRPRGRGARSAFALHSAVSRASRRPHLGSVARGDHVLPLRSSRPYHHFLTSYLHHPAVQYRSQPLRVLSRRVPLHSQGEYHYTAYAKVLPIQAWSSLRCERILPRFSFVRCPPSCFNLARRRSSTEQYGAVRSSAAKQSLKKDRESTR